jgi:hypothetical protein
MLFVFRLGRQSISTEGVNLEIIILMRILHVIVAAVFDFILNILKGVVTKCLKFIQSWMIRHSALIRRTLPRMTWLLAVLLVICVMIVGVLLVSTSATSTCIV